MTELYQNENIFAVGFEQTRTRQNILNLLSYRIREGVIIEWPQNWLFHDRHDVIIMSRAVVIRFPSNNGRYLKCRNFVSRNVIITESIDLEMTVSENHDRKL